MFQDAQQWVQHKREATAGSCYRCNHISHVFVLDRRILAAFAVFWLLIPSNEDSKANNVRDFYCCSFSHTVPGVADASAAGRSKRRALK